MSTPCDVNPALTLGAIREALIAEVMAVPAAETVTIWRSTVWLVIGSLADTSDRVEALFEAAAAADRLIRELAIARAEIGRLETRLAVMTANARCPWPVVPAVSKGRAERAHRRGEVVDLTEVLRREQLDRSRPQPPIGGGAA